MRGHPPAIMPVGGRGRSAATNLLSDKPTNSSTVASFGTVLPPAAAARAWRRRFGDLVGFGISYRRWARGGRLRRQARIVHRPATLRLRQRSSKTTDHQAAARILAKITTEMALRREGVIDAKADGYAEHGRRPVSEHVQDWIAALTAKDVTARQTALLRRRVDAILSAVGVERIGELAPSSVQGAIGELHADGLSLQTCQHYLRACKQFSRWLKRDGRSSDDALAHLGGYNAATDRRMERRALSADEAARLVQAAETGPHWRRGLSGTDRATLYRTALGTGFRAAELRSLTPASFRLDDDPPAIALQAARSKRRRADVQPIREDLAELLRAWLTDKPADAPVWPGRWHEKAAAMLRADLRRARAAWIRETPDRAERRERQASHYLAEVDASGRRVDFHALRVSYITALIQGGASVKVAQELARHSTPTLTLATYTKLGIHDLTGALETLPSLRSERPDRETLRATGTVDAQPEKAQQYAQQRARETAHSRARLCEVDAATMTPKEARKSLTAARLGDGVRARAAGSEKAADRTRTDDLRFTKPLLYRLSYGGKVLSNSEV